MADIQKALDSFREAAILPDCWPRALDVMAEALASEGATLVYRHAAVGFVAFSNNLKPFVAEYMAGPIHDPREERCRPGIHEGFMPDQAYFSSSEIAADPYYQEFLAPRGFGWNAVANLNGDLMISLKRGFGRPAYDGAELRGLNDALPGLRSASRAACLTWRSNFSGQLRAFEKLGRGALLIDRAGRFLEANACVNFGDGLDVRSGLLHASHSGSRGGLQRFLATVLSAGGEGNTSGSTTFALPRPSGRRALLLDGIASTDALRSFHSAAAALIIVTDLERSSQPAREVLRQLFQLTPMEAELARDLVAGSSLQEAAAHLSITEGHARQRLRAIFGKTATARQGELIALLARLT